jgi:hypothetical protein
LLVQTLSLEVPENRPLCDVLAEYKSLANVMMDEMSCIWCDNLRATYLYANPIVHALI